MYNNSPLAHLLGHLFSVKDLTIPCSASTASEADFPLCSQLICKEWWNLSDISQMTMGLTQRMASQQSLKPKRIRIRGMAKIKADAERAERQKELLIQ